MKTTLAAIMIIAAGLATTLLLWSVDRTHGGLNTFGVTAEPEHDYPSPSYWPMTPFPMGTPRYYPTPEVTISPCPAWAPTLIYHPEGHYYECLGVIPPDPHTGPILASPVPSPSH